MRGLSFSRARASEPLHQEEDYWLSISDLMAGLLMVFALMLLASLYHYRSGVEGIREILQVRQEVITELQGRFGGGRSAVQVDENGTVTFSEGVLFGQGSFQVSEDGREVLAAIAQEYLSVLLDNQRFRQQLRAIVIEGHTNDDGPYDYNLMLSQNRAFAVMMVLLEEAGSYQEDLQQLVTANGRSEAELVYLGPPEEGRVDKAASRRIEIHFRLNDGELLEQVLQQVDAA